MGVNEISDGCRHRIVADDIEIVETAVPSQKEPSWSFCHSPPSSLVDRDCCSSGSSSDGERQQSWCAQIVDASDVAVRAGGEPRERPLHSIDLHQAALAIAVAAAQPTRPQAEAPPRISD